MPLYDEDGDNIWSLDANYPAGSYEYKFALGNWVVGEIIPSDCPNLTSGNRSFTLSADTVLPTDSFSACPGEDPVPGGDVIFSVDMRGVDLGGQVPTLQGPFNNWCGDCAPMSDANNDGIWTVSTYLAGGDNLYKYALGAWVSQETVPGDCSNTAGGNRTVSVNGDATLAVDVYSGCPSDFVAPDGYNAPVNTTVSFTATLPAGTTSARLHSEALGWDLNHGDGVASNNGDDTWTATIPAPWAAGTNYKWYVDGAEENLLDDVQAGYCANDGLNAWDAGANRLYSGSGDVTGEVFGACSDTPVAAPPTIALPVDFEEAADAYEIAGFDGGVASVEAGPDGAVSLKYVKGAGANWAGVWINLDTAVDAANGEIVTAAVHSTVARDITLKFDAANVERVASHTGSGWEALSYDFTGAMPADQTKIAFFNDLSQQGDGSADWTIHIDNLAQSTGGDTGGDTGGTDPVAPTIALPVDFEEAADAYEIAGFDGGVASVEAGPDGAVSLKYVKGAGQNWAGVWINLDTAVDAANGEIVTADVHSTVARDITLKFDAAGVERVVSHTGSGWESLSYDFTGAMPADQTKIAFFNDLSQQGDGSADWTIHIDNLAQSTGGDTGGDTGGTDPVAPTIALPVDFEEAADAYEIAGFDGGVASVEAGPDGAVSLKYVKGAGANWAGVWINLDTAVDAANGEIVTAAVHSTVARDITLKFDAANVERVASHTGSGWEALSYDFTGAMPADQTKIAFFNDLSQQGDGSADWTIHIDNLAQSTGGDTGGTDDGPKDVTFSVDMTGVDLTDGNPTLQSTFNNWCGGCNPMSDDDGDNIWTITVNIPQGDHEYKYALGAWVSQESVPAGCDNTLGANRAVTVTGDVTLATDVYNGCPGDDTSGGDDADPVASTTYCATPVKHFLIDAEVASEVALTVERVDANTVDVSVVSTDADPVDLVLVGAQSGDAAGVSAMDLENGTATVTLTWANGAPDTTSFEVLWSKESNGGNWMLRKEDLPFINTAATCETGGDTGGTDPDPVAPTIALPVDFEEAADAYEIAGFDGGVASVEAGPDGAVSLKYVKGAGANWAGVWINLDTAVDAANGEIITAAVHSTVAREITLKFDAANVERVASHTGSGWEALSYDFTGAMPADQTKIAFFNDLSQQVMVVQTGLSILII
jgi:hypothetical protein